jgi:protein-tyrosine phosphatase
MAIAFRIMTVCTGNICRSPMAEVVLRNRFERAGLGDVVAVDSTGVSGEEEGNGIDPRARLVLAARGYPVPEHRARRVLPAQLFERDLVLAATSAHARRLSAIAAEAGWDRAGEPGRIALIRAFDPALTGGAGLDLDDPWSGTARDFELCLDQVEASADGVLGQVGEFLGAWDGSRLARGVSWSSSQIRGGARGARRAAH